MASIYSHGSPDIPITLVDTTTAISALVDSLYQLPITPPSICIDLEGINLCRDGSISLIPILAQPGPAQRHAYLIDVHVLGDLAFTTTGTKNTTLKTILESPTISKVFFDVRNDSDALYAHFKIFLQGIIDVQLMEIATRRPTAPRKFVNGLAKCIEYDVVLSRPAKVAWKLSKTKGERLFKPDLGGSYAVFNTRPLSDDLRSYCVRDVQYLPALQQLYAGTLTAVWKKKIEVEAKNRVLLSQSPDYEPQGKDKALGPWQDWKHVGKTSWNDFDDLVEDMFDNLMGF